MTEAFQAYSATKTHRPNPSVDRAPPASGRPSRVRHSYNAAERDHAAFQRVRRPHGNAARASTLSILHFSRRPPAPSKITTFDLIDGVAVASMFAVEIDSPQAIRRSHEMLRERLHFLYFTFPA